MSVPHKEIHDSIKKAVNCVANGTYTQESQNVMTCFKDTSIRVVDNLNSMLQEEKAFRHNH